jgi:hypothetical protein
VGVGRAHREEFTSRRIAEHEDREDLMSNETMTPLEDRRELHRCSNEKSLTARGRMSQENQPPDEKQKTITNPIYLLYCSDNR